MFYRDEFLGEFSGNILEDIAKSFPEPVSERILSCEPIPSEWKLYERITWEGIKGYRYYSRKGTSIKILGVMNSIYTQNHQLKGYPGIFDGSKDDLPSFIVNVNYELFFTKQEIQIDDEHFVIWLTEKVDILQK
jgi:hypothetical protein